MPLGNCLICSKEIYIKPSHLKRGWGKYCSKKCQSKSQKTGKIVTCAYCGNKVYRCEGELGRISVTKNFFCNRACHCAWENKNRRVGQNAPNWVDGERVYRKILLAGNKISIICTQCGHDDVRVLVAHHKDGDRKNNKIDNLKWLCRNCHYLVHEGKTI